MDIKKLKPAANKVLIKILNADRESTFEKKITRDDGTTTSLIISTDLRLLKDEYGNEFFRALEEVDNDRNQYFVRTGRVISVGEDVKTIIPGDVAILDYTVDTRDDIVIGRDKEGKYVCICGVTSFYQHDIIENAQRNSTRDQVVAFRGEIMRLTDIVAVIRNGKILSINPYVILTHAPVEQETRTGSGIIYIKKDGVIRRKVMAVPAELKEAKDRGQIVVEEGSDILIKDADCFDISLETGIMTGCFSHDIMAKCKS